MNGIHHLHLLLHRAIPIKYDLAESKLREHAPNCDEQQHIKLGFYATFNANNIIHTNDISVTRFACKSRLTNRSSKQISLPMYSGFLLAGINTIYVNLCVCRMCRNCGRSEGWGGFQFQGNQQQKNEFKSDYSTKYSQPK